MQQNLSPAQQAQLDNRDSSGQFKQKTHADVDDTADVLGVEARPDQPPARDPRQIQPLDESGVELTDEQHGAVYSQSRKRGEYHRRVAEDLDGLSYSWGGEPDADTFEEAKFHRAAQWAYEAEPHASFAAFEPGEHRKHDLVQYNRHGQMIRDTDGTPKTLGAYEMASPADVPGSFRTDDGHFDIKQARAASDHHLEGVPRPELKPWEKRPGHMEAPLPRDEDTRVAFAKAAHRASAAATRWGNFSTDRDVAADEAEAIDQATRHIPTTSLREPATRDTGVIDHETPGEARERIFNRDEARAEADWQREI